MNYICPKHGNVGGAAFLSPDGTAYCMKCFWEALPGIGVSICKDGNLFGMDKFGEAEW